MCYSTLLKRIIPTPKIQKYDKFLFVSAHCGDLAKSSGATISKLANKGKSIKAIITTNSLSTVNCTVDKENEMVEKRKKEELVSFAILGVKDAEFFDFHDGVGVDFEELVKKLVKKISEYKPDVVFVDDVNTPNEINIADAFTAKATLRATEILKSNDSVKIYDVEKHRIKAICLYNTIKPNCFVGVRKELSSKLNAVMAQTSTVPTNAVDKFAYMKSYKSLIKFSALRNGLKCGKLYAEGFYAIGGKATHNMPEINF